MNSLGGRMQRLARPSKVLEAWQATRQPAPLSAATPPCCVLPFPRTHTSPFLLFYHRQTTSDPSRISLLAISPPYTATMTPTPRNTHALLGDELVKKVQEIEVVMEKLRLDGIQHNIEQAQLFPEDGANSTKNEPNPSSTKRTIGELSDTELYAWCTELVNAEAALKSGDGDPEEDEEDTDQLDFTDFVARLTEKMRKEEERLPLKDLMKQADMQMTKTLNRWDELRKKLEEIEMMLLHERLVEYRDKRGGFLIDENTKEFDEPRKKR